MKTPTHQTSNKGLFMKLMVYGTLKRGYWNNRLLANATFLGESVTKGKYVLYDCGFPMAVVPPEETEHPALPIIGEVFEVDDITLRDCDRLEGHPTFYRRTLVPILLEGVSDEVWMYELVSGVGTKQLSNITDNMYNWVG